MNDALILLSKIGLMLLLLGAVMFLAMIVFGMIVSVTELIKSWIGEKIGKRRKR